MVGVMLVDRKGRNSCCRLAQRVLSPRLVCAGFMFQQNGEGPRRLQGCHAKAGHRLPNGHAGTGSQAGDDGPPQSVSFNLDGEYCAGTYLSTEAKPAIDLSRSLRERSQGRWRQGGQGTARTRIGRRQTATRTNANGPDRRQVGRVGRGGRQDAHPHATASTIVDKADGNLLSVRQQSR